MNKIYRLNEQIGSYYFAFINKENIRNNNKIR